MKKLFPPLQEKINKGEEYCIFDSCGLLYWNCLLFSKVDKKDSGEKLRFWSLFHFASISVEKAESDRAGH